MGFIYAAYKEGAFDDLIMRDLPPETFAARIEALMGSVEYDWILEDDKPFGLVLGRSIMAGRGVECQVDWFPWASPRNRIEGMAIFLREIPKQLKVMFFSDDESKPFWQRFCRYRMIRNGCQIVNYFSGGKHAHMYYTTGPA